MSLQPFTRVTGKAAPMLAANIDTDVIMPKQFLKGIDRSGLDRGLFFDLRFLADGRPNPAFILNHPQWQGACFLIVGPNFGCGSSREHAPWALEDQGFRVVIAPSFADIFFNNCFKNGLLPIVQPAEVVDQLFRECEANEGYRLNVDLAAQTITTPSGQSFGFDVTEHRKHCLLGGLDEIGLTLQHADDIKAFEARRRAEQPWLFA